MSRPSAAAVLLALIPFAAMCFSVALWDRIRPMLFGLPFNLLWLAVWVVLTSLCMWLVYRIERTRAQRRAGGV